MTHFGPGGRVHSSQVTENLKTRDPIASILDGDNPFLQNVKLKDHAVSHLGTQGDGNHFVFVGRSPVEIHGWLRIMDRAVWGVNCIKKAVRWRRHFVPTSVRI